MEQLRYSVNLSIKTLSIGSLNGMKTIMYSLYFKKYNNSIEHIFQDLQDIQYTQVYILLDPKKHKDIYPQYKKTIELLQHNPHHPSLRIHKLQGKMDKFSSISINMKYRIVIDFIIIDEVIILVDIGSHDDVYQSKICFNKDCNKFCITSHDL